MAAEQHSTGSAIPHFPNIVSLIAEQGHGAPWSQFLMKWETTIFSLIAIALIGVVAYFATRRRSLVPGRLQAFAEMLVSGLDDFICGILGPRGRKYTPFIGTLFIYIFTMNYIGLIPFFKSPTTDWSVTVGLAIIVFAYVQYTAFRELGALGYADHLMGKPRGVMAMIVILPIFMFALHLLGEFVRPFTLSLRLRSNMWGDDMLLGLMASKGLAGLPVFVINYFVVILAATIQAIIFSLLTLIYFALILVHEEEH